MEVSVKQLKKAANQPSEKDIEAAGPHAEATRPEEKPLIKSITKNNIVGATENLKKRKELISEKGLEPTDFAFERAIGRNDSLYSNFAELIALTKRKVGRIVIIEGGEKTGYATGFMVSGRLLLTNWHVFQSQAVAEESEVHFFYEYDAEGHPLNPTIFKFDTTAFFNDEDLDYCFVAVQPTDVTGKVPLESIGYLYLDKTLGKIGDINVEKLNIIHHPLGDYKQISIRENTFAGIEDTKISYETDTAPGSSGSPVFNDQWQVVGLHHKSIAKMSQDGNHYLDKHGDVIPIKDGKIDASRIVWLKNEGMRISVILNHVTQKFSASELVGGLSVPPPQEDLTFTINGGTASSQQRQITAVRDVPGRNININVPVDALSADRSIEISVSSKAIHTDGDPTVAVQAHQATDELLLEVAKAEKEQKTDFGECQGYDPKFLGVDIPMPLPAEAIARQIARLKDNQVELKYFKHSVIFNAVTRMPLISAVNVEGDAALRLDNSKRNDDWLRDSRIDIECQLTDKFYAKSNFDKGHMSRFEDADWGASEAQALRSGIYTCFYTNACPQVADLNRAGGLWGQLEKAVLEKGIKKQQGQEARMTVFNGPIFSEGKDRVFKGARIPMEFYKIIVWLGDDGKPRATAFKLSQEALVNDIKFDESMRLADEALDIDKDVVFQHYQSSIKALGALTNIDFSHLEQYDTFPTDVGGQECFIESVESIRI